SDATVVRKFRLTSGLAEFSCIWRVRVDFDRRTCAQEPTDEPLKLVPLGVFMLGPSRLDGGGERKV
ncbi:hypothetical protein JS562_31155, partial [Agrobacterium sp. S2]|nr:hypothetical protein [Agrobacterium sp. S2]